MGKRIKGSKLIFISQINRDGSGTSEVVGSYESILQKEHFSINVLSLSEGTFIASGFNSFVVKLKQNLNK